MTNIRIVHCSNPEKWYAQKVGRVYLTERSLFGYKITEGEDKGKLIFAGDCKDITPTRAERIARRA